MLNSNNDNEEDTNKRIRKTEKLYQLDGLEQKRDFTL